MKNYTKDCDLQCCIMCKLVLKEWKLPLEQQRKNYLVKKGGVIFKEGDLVKGIYFVNSGKVKVHQRWGEKELIVRFAGDGAMIGHRGLSTKNVFYPVSATALEPTSLCFIELDFFMASLKVNHEFALWLLMFYADELQESEKKMRNLAHMPVKGRLALAILQLEELFGLTEAGFINIQLSRQDLAAFIGTTYETVFRTMSDLVKENLISISGKNIGVNDRCNLLSIASDI